MKKVEVGVQRGKHGLGKGIEDYISPVTLGHGFWVRVRSNLFPSSVHQDSAGV